MLRNQKSVIYLAWISCKFFPLSTFCRMMSMQLSHPEREESGTRGDQYQVVIPTSFSQQLLILCDCCIAHMTIKEGKKTP